MVKSFKNKKLEKAYRGDRQAIWSVTVRANWRITFKFENRDAYILNYEDYH